MNCFTFLGLAEDHRPHPVQLVLHRDELSAPQKKLAETYPTYGQVKRDGVFCMLIVPTGGIPMIFGRTGKLLTNTQALATNLGCMLSSGVYFGELQTLCIASLEELSGVVNPERVNALDWKGQQIADELYIDFFDMLTIPTFIAGKAETTYLNRHAALVRRMSDVVALGLSNVLDNTPLLSEEEVIAFADKHISEDREGAVFKLDKDWMAGHKGYRQTKIVRGISHDLLCIGWEEGKGKYEGKVANLIFKWKDSKTIKAMLGKGWTHELAEQMYHDIRLGGGLNVIGRIFEVTALQPSSKGKLRLVKCGELRHDKVTPDF